MLSVAVGRLFLSILDHNNSLLRHRLRQSAAHFYHSKQETYYEVLGVSPTSSRHNIKAAFRAVSPVMNRELSDGACLGCLAAVHLVTCSLDNICAHMQKAKTLHPDVQQTPESSSAFLRLLTAYEVRCGACMVWEETTGQVHPETSSPVAQVLSNERERLLYDLSLDTNAGRIAKEAAAGTQAAPRCSRYARCGMLQPCTTAGLGVVGRGVHGI